SDLADQPGLYGYRSEIAPGHHAEPGMLPSGERFEPHHPARTKARAWLKTHYKFAIRHCGMQGGLKLRTLSQLHVHVQSMDAVAVSRFLLCTSEGDMCCPQQRFRAIGLRTARRHTNRRGQV